MYNGKHAKTKSYQRAGKAVMLLAALFLIFTVGVGYTLAFLVTNTEPVVNTFTPSTMSGEITEDFSGETKSNVQVSNTGDVAAYIRAAVVVNWVDDDGHIVPTPVEPGDYTISLNQSDWFKVGEYYYYRTPVAAGASTNNLINSCTVTAAGKAKGYRLSVEILAQAIQAEPKAAVEEAWGTAIANQLSE